MTTLSERLWEVLTEEPQSKWTLADRLHTNEREIRRCITELRMFGYNVASSSRGKGYWKGSTVEMAALAREYDSRANECYKIATAIRQGPDIGQMEVSL